MTKIEPIDVTLKLLEKFPDPNNYTDWSVYSSDVYSFFVDMGLYSGGEIEFKEQLNDRIAKMNLVAGEINSANINVNNKEASATQSATIATTKANEAQASATTATTKANEASASANTASTKATEASNSASSALSSKNSASASATTATTKASEASSSASSALSSMNTATTKANEAEASANTASTKAAEASNSASIASAKASEASSSAASALASKNAAKTSETNAKTSEEKAKEYMEASNTANALMKANNLGDLSNVATAKVNLGLGNVNNTSDVNKPISSATQTALDGKLDKNANAVSATKLATARTIGGVSFDGTANINLPGVNIAGNQSTTGNAGSASKLATARTIGGVSFDGTANINLPGVNIAGNQSTTGNAGSASKLATARTINGVAFDGTVNITIADSTKAPLAHNHDASHINAGTLSVDRLPTIPNTKISGLGTASTRNVGTGSGNVMEVGAFGLGNEINLTSAMNLNTITTSGFYRNIANAFATPANNYPIAQAGNLIVMNTAGTTQMYITYSGGTKQIYIRGNYGGTWTAWNAMIGTHQLASATGTSIATPMTQKAVTDALNKIANNAAKKPLFEKSYFLGL